MAQAPAGDFAEEPAPQSVEQAADVTWAPPDELPAAAEMEAVPDEPGAALEVEAPPIAPVDLDAGQPPIEVEATAEADPEPLEDIETYAARHQQRGFRRPSLHWPLSNLQSGILALAHRRRHPGRLAQRFRAHSAADRVVLFVAGPAGEPARAGVRRCRHDHRAARRRADPRGRRQHRQRHPQDRRRAAAEIRGPQRSQARKSIPGPPFRRARRCRPAKRYAFRSRLASPPTDGHDVLVRFVTRHDIVAGTR